LIGDGDQLMAIRFDNKKSFLDSLRSNSIGMRHAQQQKAVLKKSTCQYEAARVAAPSQ
jgi:hypothetical protein